MSILLLTYAYRKPCPTLCTATKPEPVWFFSVINSSFYAFTFVWNYVIIPVLIPELWPKIVSWGHCNLASSKFNQLSSESILMFISRCNEITSRYSVFTGMGRSFGRSSGRMWGYSDLEHLQISSFNPLVWGNVCAKFDQIHISGFKNYLTARLWPLLLLAQSREKQMQTLQCWYE